MRKRKVATLIITTMLCATPVVAASSISVSKTDSWQDDDGTHYEYEIKDENSSFAAFPRSEDKSLENFVITKSNVPEASPELFQFGTYINAYESQLGGYVDTQYAIWGDAWAGLTDYSKDCWELNPVNEDRESSLTSYSQYLTPVSSNSPAIVESAVSTNPNIRMVSQNSCTYSADKTMVTVVSNSSASFSGQAWNDIGTYQRKYGCKITPVSLYAKNNRTMTDITKADGTQMSYTSNSLSLSWKTQGKYGVSEENPVIVVFRVDMPHTGYIPTVYTDQGSSNVIYGNNQFMGNTAYFAYQTYASASLSRSFTFRFETNGGEPVEDLICDSSISDTWVLPTPVRSGYVFKGWYTDSTLTQKYDYTVPAFGSVTQLYAKWEKQAEDPANKTYTITYYLNGGSFNSYYPTTFKSGDTLGIPSPVREGYRFDGWYMDDSYSEKFTGSLNPLRDFSLYAKWVKAGSTTGYPITYVLNGGVNPASAPTSFELGKTTVLPVPTREGYLFTGWYADAACTVPFSGQTVSGPVTLYAGWKKSENTGGGSEQEPGAVKIIYELNGGVNPAGALTEIPNGGVLYLPTPTKTGYTFKGWYLDESCTKSASTISGGFSANTLTLYAKWDEAVYSVLYHANGGAMPSPYISQFTYRSGLSQFLTPVSNTMDFDGWYADAALSQPVASIAPNTYACNVNLYAKWKQKTSSGTPGSTDMGNVKIYDENGNLIDPNAAATVKQKKEIKVYYNYIGKDCDNPNPDVISLGETISLKNPKRKGYLFEGWYSDEEQTNKIDSISYSGKEPYIKIHAKWKYIDLSISKLSVKNIKKNTLKFKWGKVKMAEGYQIQVSLHKKFKKSKKYKTQTFNFGKSKTSCKVKNLSRGKKYYIRMRTYSTDSTGKKVYSTWTGHGRFLIYR